MSLHKLRGSLTPAALGAFVVSCQLGQSLLALAVFSAFHSAPALPLVLLGGSGRLCRRLSTRPAPSGAGRFFRYPQGPPCLLLTSYSVLFRYTPTLASKAIRFALLLASVSLFSVRFSSYTTQSSRHPMAPSVRRVLLPYRLSLASNFAICAVISMFRRRFVTVQVKGSTLSPHRHTKDIQTLV